jgi:hypothetical protein
MISLCTVNVSETTFDQFANLIDELQKDDDYEEKQKNKNMLDFFYQFIIKIQPGIVESERNKTAIA